MRTYVLVPGAGGDSWYWHLVAPLLEERGHDVITPDLPAGDDTAGLREYADAVVEAVGNGGDLTVVAQSLGAFTAPLVCERVDVSLLILVAPMIPSPGESAGEWWSAHVETSEIDIRTTLMHDVPDAVVAEAFDRGEPRQSDRPFGDAWPLDAWPDVRTQVVAGRNDRLFPLETTKRLARERLGVEADVIDTGHLPALARPDELAQRLEAYGL